MTGFEEAEWTEENVWVELSVEQLKDFGRLFFLPYVASFFLDIEKLQKIIYW